MNRFSRSVDAAIRVQGEVHRSAPGGTGEGLILESPGEFRAGEDHVVFPGRGHHPTGVAVERESSDPIRVGDHIDDRGDVGGPGDDVGAIDRSAGRDGGDPDEDLVAGDLQIHRQITHQHDGSMTAPPPIGGRGLQSVEPGASVDDGPEVDAGLGDRGTTVVQGHDPVEDLLPDPWQGSSAHHFGQHHREVFVDQSIDFQADFVVSRVENRDLHATVGHQLPVRDRQPNRLRWWWGGHGSDHRLLQKRTILGQQGRLHSDRVGAVPLEVGRRDQIVSLDAPANRPRIRGDGRGGDLLGRIETSIEVDPDLSIRRRSPSVGGRSAEIDEVSRDLEPSADLRSQIQAGVMAGEIGTDQYPDRGSRAHRNLERVA